MRHPKATAWEDRLKDVFDRIDHRLEAQYGDRYVLRSSRPEHGDTPNPEHSGLFNVGAAFSAGYGSEHGPGYIVEVRLSTMSRVPDDVRQQIEDQVAVWLREDLPMAFPGRTLHVSRDGAVYKIHGDLGLGRA